ncbi:LPS export ABC transporter permease LptF [Zoogloea sp.]|uniref:LPS export ABC transporter permease LptF n=1 Tax=Zoogloea sp. TaxID=49181 RepID=UPI00260F2977|nr:LPS export ABC transporter permease LptF [Zoogloea sp.]MDD3354264.1 LPS export ABC transporter permease LptF [Zoogloea sp.]
MIFLRAAQREFTQNAVAVFVALFAILISTVLIRLLGQAAGGRVPADAVLALIGFGAIAQMPVVLSLTVFIAILMTLSRWYRDSEMVVWFSSGLPLTAWIRPVLRFAVPVVLVIAGLSLFASPWAQKKSADYKEQLSSRDDVSRVAPGLFRESSGGEKVFFVEALSTDEGSVRNVFASSMQNGRLGVMVAARGHTEVDATGNRFVVLENGRRYEGTPGTPSYRVMEFERYRLRMESKEAAGGPRQPRSLPLPALLKNPDNRSMAELMARISAPLLALMLALLAIPLSFVNPRAGRTNNLVLAVLIYLIYSNAVSVCQAWVGQGRLRFEVALVAPHLVMLGVLALLFVKRIRVLAFWRKKS